MVPARMSRDLDKTTHWLATEVSPSSASKRAWVTVITGCEAGRVYPLAVGTHIIGRSSEASIQLSDEAVSRFHTQLSVDADGHATVMDCGSKNGTLLGSRSVTQEPVALRDGSKLHIGGAALVRFSFRDQIEESYERALYDSINMDHLTGAFNKRYFDVRNQQEIAQSSRTDRPFSLVLFDLDDFKSVNDSLGHVAGDHVLREVARIFTNELRSSELLARCGGEEFVVVMTQSDVAAAMVLAERLRRLLNTTKIAWKGGLISITASFGVASTSSGRIQVADDLFQEADECLYRAKRAGKNRVCGPGHS
ncbi:MAG: two-component system cell cycle response regulator [Planctomycetota bacterium]|jgi:two-component system cell cycle response regulator